MSEVVSANEAARRFGLSEKTVRRWIAAGRLKADKHGRAYGVVLSEVAALSGHGTGHDRGPSADSGQVSANGSASPTADSMSAVSGIPDLVALVTRLHDEVRQYAEAAAMWQTRAEVLSMQLDQARGELRALQAPADPAAQNGQEGPYEGHSAAQGSEPPLETPTPPPPAPVPSPTPEPVPPPAPEPMPPGRNGSGWWGRVQAWLMA